MRPKQPLRKLLLATMTLLLGAGADRFDGVASVAALESRRAGGQIAAMAAEAGVVLDRLSGVPGPARDVSARPKDGASTAITSPGERAAATPSLRDRGLG